MEREQRKAERNERDEIKEQGKRKNRRTSEQKKSERTTESKQKKRKREKNGNKRKNRKQNLELCVRSCAVDNCGSVVSAGGSLPEESDA